MDCEQIAVQFPWKCYTMVDVREHCKATCFKWGLIRIANPLCNFTELEISVQNGMCFVNGNIINISWAETLCKIL